MSNLDSSLQCYNLSLIFIPVLVYFDISQPFLPVSFTEEWLLDSLPPLKLFLMRLQRTVDGSTEGPDLKSRVRSFLLSAVDHFLFISLFVFTAAIPVVPGLWLIPLWESTCWHQNIFLCLLNGFTFGIFHRFSLRNRAKLYDLIKGCLKLAIC